MYFWRSLRSCPIVQEMIHLASVMGPQTVVEHLRIEQAKQKAEDRPVDDYDLIVSLDSVRDLGEKSAGCAVLATCEKAVDMFEKPINVRAVSVLGLYNTGKTFLQSNLFGFNFPQGPLVRTSGLSMKMLEEFNLLIVDSAGNLEPVSTESSTGSISLEEAVKDRKDVELLNKELAFHLSDILIVVVNDITWPEQEFCQSFATRCYQKPRKGLIVVHNMRHIRDSDVAQKRFHDQVSQVYQGQAVRNIKVSEGADDVLEFVHRDSNQSELLIHHFGLANQYSPAGQKFNQGAFKQIRAVIDFHDRVGSKRCIKNVIKDQATKLLPQFFYCDDDKSSAKLKVEYAKSDNKEGCIGVFFLHQPNNAIVHMRHSHASGVNNSWEPSISWTVETSRNSLSSTSSHQELLHLRIEVSGVSKENIEVKDTEDGLLVAINKVKEPAEEAGVTMVLESGRVYSTWRRLFDYRVPGCGEFQAPSSKGVMLRNGILHIHMARAKKKGAIDTSTPEDAVPDGTTPKAIEFEQDDDASADDYF